MSSAPEPGRCSWTCADEVELLGAMRRLLAERDLVAIEARRFGERVLALHA